MDKSSVINFFEVFEKVIRYARIDVARIFVFSNRSRAQLDNLKEIFYVPTFCNLIGDAFWHAISFVFERAIPLCKRASTYPTRKWALSSPELPEVNCRKWSEFSVGAPFPGFAQNIVAKARILNMENSSLARGKSCRSRVIIIQSNLRGIPGHKTRMNCKLQYPVSSPQIP